MRILKSIILGALLTLVPLASFANQDQTQCIATAIYYEARGSTREDKIGVGNVIMNRVRDRRFPNTPCAVVYQRSQFSWTSGGWAHQSRYLELARQIQSGNIEDNTQNSLYFWSVRIGTPNWARGKRIIRIGQHYYAR